MQIQAHNYAQPSHLKPSSAPTPHKNKIDFTDEIIIIDDDQDDRDNVASMLKKMDEENKLRFFTNGDEFLHIIQGQDLFWNEDQKLGLPKFIIIDMHMPHKNGVETIKAIRSNSLWSGVPIILVTGTNDDDKIDRAYELGANAFLSKPFTQIDLIQSVYQGFNFSSNLI